MNSRARHCTVAKITQALPNAMDGTAEYGRGHDGSPQDGYRESGCLGFLMREPLELH